MITGIIFRVHYHPVQLNQLLDFNRTEEISQIASEYAERVCMEHGGNFALSTDRFSNVGCQKLYYTEVVLLWVKRLRK